MMMTLANTAPLMSNENYKTRFFAEYAQTKIRYEKLKALCDEIEASILIGAPRKSRPMTARCRCSANSNAPWVNICTVSNSVPS